MNSYKFCGYLGTIGACKLFILLDDFQEQEAKLYFDTAKQQYYLETEAKTYYIENSDDASACDTEVYLQESITLKEITLQIYTIRYDLDSEIDT